MGLTACAMVIALGTHASADIERAQERVLAAKPAAVLVTARVDADVVVDCGTGRQTVKAAPFVENGTGWLVDGRGLVITNAHVIDPAHARPPWVLQELRRSAIEKACVDPVLARQGLMRGDRIDIEEQLRRRADPARVTVNAVPSIVVTVANGKTLRADVKKFSPPLRLDARGTPLPGSGRDLALLAIAPGVYPALSLAAETPRIGETVHIIGFPGVVLRHELLSRTAVVEATVTKGFVSSFKTDAIGQDVIQTDAGAAHGSSGAPAIGPAGSVLGVLTFVSLSRDSGDVVQGFNFLIPAKDVGRFLDGMDVTPGDSKFGVVWRAGLRDLFSGHYGSAAARLAEADTLVPGLPDVKRVLEEARNPPPQPFPWLSVAIGVTVVSAAAFGAIAWRSWWRNRFRIRASEVARMLEDGKDLLIIDVRDVTRGQIGGLRIPGALRVTPAALARGEMTVDGPRDRTVVAYCS